MKALKALMAIAISLFFAGQAFATATYDNTSSLMVEFNYAFYTATPHATAYETNMTGTAYASYGSEFYYPADGYGAGVSALSHGYAGNSTGTASGSASSSMDAFFDLDFYFPVANAVEFIITYIDSDIDINTARDFPLLETALGGGSMIMSLDGNDIWFTNGVYNTTLSGSHTVTLRAYASGRAEATAAPAPVPEPSTFILLGAGLAGLVAWRRKRS